MLVASQGCVNNNHRKELPESSRLGTFGSLRVARVVTHLHSPYSFDACDNQGLSSEQVPNPTCLANLRAALCSNRIDFAFLTDHLDQMKSFDFKYLVLKQEGDTLTSKNGQEVLNEQGGCSNGHKPLVMAGFESRLISLGMTQHLAPTPSERETIYSTETASLRAELQSLAEALVVIPHTESRSLETIRAVVPDAIEIYNVHANLDPKIRKQYLNESAFDPIPYLMSYLVDPYSDLIPDFSFLTFVKVQSLYFEKWNALIAGGLRVTGVVGNDGHENLLSNPLTDGERLDSFRRILRMVNNHVYVANVSETEVKAALKSGRSSVVFEGLGSPTNYSFTANRKDDASETARIGDSLNLNGGSAVLKATPPSLNADSTQGSVSPSIRMILLRINSDGSETQVAEATDAPIELEVSRLGNYRLDVYIRPRHLSEFLAQFVKLADEEFRWIVTNPITLK